MYFTHCLSATSPLSQFFELLLLPLRTYSHFLSAPHDWCAGQALGLLVPVQLRTLLHFHLAYQPWFFMVLTSLRYGEILSRRGFTLRCLQRLSCPYLATLLCPLREQQVHQRYVQPGPLVLRSALLKFPTPVMNRDRTVSRRSEPSSRTALMGEQPNPLEPTTLPGCDEPTSRCQTSPIDVDSWGNQPVIPRVAFIR